MTAVDYLDGALSYRAGFAGAAAPDWRRALLRDTPWSQPRVRLFGRQLDSPRLACWYGDAGAVYTYSGQRNRPRPWTPLLEEIRRAVEHDSGEIFNSVLLNLYRDGDDRMGWHADDEAELGEQPLIASLSLGACRRFRLAHRRRRQHRCELLLGDGSLLLMRPLLQSEWRHCVPREPAVTAARINLTFRRVLG